MKLTLPKVGQTWIDKIGKYTIKSITNVVSCSVRTNSSPDYYVGNFYDVALLWKDKLI